MTDLYISYFIPIKDLEILENICVIKQAKNEGMIKLEWREKTTTYCISII